MKTYNSKSTTKLSAFFLKEKLDKSFCNYWSLEISDSNISYAEFRFSHPKSGCRTYSLK